MWICRILLILDFPNHFCFFVWLSSLSLTVWRFMSSLLVLYTRRLPNRHLLYCSALVEPCSLLLPSFRSFDHHSTSILAHLTTVGRLESQRIRRKSRQSNFFRHHFSSWVANVLSLSLWLTEFFLPLSLCSYPRVPSRSWSVYQQFFFVTKT